jgi:N-acetyl-anhydromuramyl-L-alanine amidase AmpD
VYPTEVRLTPFNHYDGRTSPIIGIIVHATRSGIPGFKKDYEATINTFWSQAAQVSAHQVVREDGQRCIVVADEDTAWHAGGLNPSTLGVEVCQPTMDTPFTDAQVRSTAELCDLWCTVHNIPRTRDFIKGHEETSQGIAAGKTDPGPAWPWDEFMSLLEGDMTDEEARKQIAIINLAERWASMIRLGNLQQVLNEAKAFGVVAQ